MKHNIEFKNFTPEPHIPELVEELIGRLARHAPSFTDDAAFLRLFVDEYPTRKLYHVTLTCEVPKRTLAAKEERHDLEEAIRAAFAEIERQLEKHKEHLAQRGVGDVRLL